MEKDLSHHTFDQFLKKNNLSVHTYTSPHLIKFNERIRVNSKLINNQYLSELLEECEDKNNGESITFLK